jgi:hypothetical protein
MVAESSCTALPLPSPPVRPLPVAPTHPVTLNAPRHHCKLGAKMHRVAHVANVAWRMPGPCFRMVQA